ncbi:hypothetical protein HCB37_04190 [Listeria booriae]|uniref:hypothetical protein n=1 Tax=Listeria booriae TaxID=1552123 RepID=UPI001627E13B|nr:hypothetical protein [Listeria booriae]MBC2048224.1 hypothetical protein [Listeria booriae]MBC2263712.1 hypothetical protein [Listeria booriae]
MEEKESYLIKIGKVYINDRDGFSENIEDARVFLRYEGLREAKSKAFKIGGEVIVKTVSYKFLDEEGEK